MGNPPHRRRRRANAADLTYAPAPAHYSRQPDRAGVSSWLVAGLSL